MRTDVPAELDEIFQQLIAKRPEDRFGSADELLDALMPMLHRDSAAWSEEEIAESALDVVPYVPMVQPRRAPSRTGRRVWLVGSIAALAVMAAGVAWFFWPRGDRGEAGGSASALKVPIADMAIEPTMSLIGHANTVECLAFTPDGRQMVSSDDDQLLLVWDLAAGRLAYQLVKGDDTGPALALDSSGKLLATAAENDLLKLWDMAAKTVVARLKGHHVAFSRSGDLLAAALHDDPIALYDMTTRQSVGELVGHDAWVQALIFSDDGATLISGDEYGVLRIWDVARRAQRTAVTCDVQINSLVMLPTGDLVAGDCADGVARIWNIKTYAQEASWPAHEGPAWCAACSHDGRLLASAGADGNIVLWDLPTRRRLLAWRAHQGESMSVAFSPDDKRLASGGDDLTVKLWDVGRLLLGQRLPPANE